MTPPPALLHPYRVIHCALPAPGAQTLAATQIASVRVFGKALTYVGAAEPKGDLVR